MTATTEPNAPLTPEATAQLRHDLRTPVNHIVGYAEMLLEDAAEASLAPRKPALEETLAAARDVLSAIDRLLGGRSDGIAADEVVGLYRSLREPQQRIVRAVEGLLQLSDPAPNQDFTSDLHRILGAAAKLIPAGTGVKDRAQTDRDAPTVDESGGERTATILVVDDVEDNREVLRRRLAREGYEVECAENGRRASSDRERAVPAKRTVR